MSTIYTTHHINHLNGASLFLKERQSLLGSLYETPSDEQLKRAAKDQWRRDALLFDEKQYHSRLASDQMDEDQFEAVIASVLNDKQSVPLTLLGSSEEDGIGLAELEEALRLNRITPVHEDIPPKLISAFRPFLLWAVREWDRAMDSMEDVRMYLNIEGVRDSLISELTECLLQIGARSLVLELHISKKLDELKGSTPEERFRYFVKNKLCTVDGLDFIYREYPMLGRLLMIRTIYIVRAVLESVSRYVNDVHEISAAFPSLNIQSGQTIVSFSAGMGDAHQQGRSVTRFKYESGMELIYKPKPLAVSRHFSELLVWMNEKGFGIPFLPLGVIDQGDYGWEQFITSEECKNEEEIERFYHRLGGLLALIYSVRGTDFHMENIIAHGEHPVPIDLETLFHNSPSLHFADTADVEAKKKLVESVVGTGLLPLLLYQNEEGVGIELSGMGGKEQMLPFPVLQVENDETDNMRFVRKSKMSSGSSNRPKMQGEECDASKYVDHIVLGFREACNIIIQYRCELLGEAGPLASFKDDTIRIILRATQFYANFLMESHHPNYTRDALEREKLMDRLWYTALDSRAIHSERIDLLYGDIPYFTSTPSSRDLKDSRGQCIAEFFSVTSYDQVLERISELDEKEVDRQSDWIVSSILGSADWFETQPSCCTQPAQPSSSRTDIEKNNAAVYLEHAKEIGNYLLEEAVYSKEQKDATWIDIGMNYRGQWSVSAMKGGIYDGTAGPALFLAYLGSVTGEQAYTKLARQAMKTSIASLPYNKGFSSAFYGHASVLYAIAHMSALNLLENNEDELVPLIISNLDAIVSNDRCYDVLGGAAGVIPVLLQIYKQYGLEQALHTAKRYGDHLIKNAVRTKNGAGWPAVTNEQLLLGGFAHGAGGIAWSLEELAQVTNDSSYREYATAALSYERSLYNSELENWVDLRKKESAAAKHPKHWCHGSAGIGMSRIMLLNSRPEESDLLHREIDTAINTTMAQGLGSSHCLCHGDMGNSELLLLASRELGRIEYQKAAEEVADRVISEKLQTGKYRTGVPRGVRTPGLFLGYSGVGYQLLRLSNPDKVPSVLTLQGPLASK